MWDSTVDFVARAASSSLFIFCFCNVIIVILLVGSKRSVGFDREVGIPLLTVAFVHGQDGLGENGRRSGAAEGSEGTEAEEGAEDREFAEGSLQGGRGGDWEEEEEEEESEDEEEKMEDDQLRRRVEEFIARVNRGWQAELQTSVCQGVAGAKG